MKRNIIANKPEDRTMKATYRIVNNRHSVCVELEGQTRIIHFDDAFTANSFLASLRPYILARTNL